jgi:putative FMN-dependent luciferase-like monooxygenase
MQFGVYTVGDRTANPITGRIPSEAERLHAMVAIAVKAEEVGFDVFATGEHHTAPFVSSAPVALLAYVAARTERLLLSTATTLITINDPVRIAEEYGVVQHLADGRLELMLGRGNTPEVYPWFGQDARDSRDLAAEHYTLLRRLWREGNLDWSGRFRAPLTGFTALPRPLNGVPPFVWHAATRSAQVADTAARFGDGFFATHIFWPWQHTARMVNRYRELFDGYGHPGRPVVGLGGQVFVRPDSQHAVREFRPYFDRAPVYGGGPSLEEYTAATPLTVGSPQQVIDRTLTFSSYAGPYQRQMFLIDHAGLPLPVVLDQLDLLGERVLPVLRQELAQPPVR